jgi:hypothetical protein
MHIRLKDDSVESDVLIGPLPEFNETFESFIKRKAFEQLMLLKNNSENDRQQVENDEQVVRLSFNSGSIYKFFPFKVC